MILKKQITDVEKWATSNAKIVAEYNKLPKQTENLLETAYCDAYSQIVSLSEKTEGKLKLPKNKPMPTEEEEDLV